MSAADRAASSMSQSMTFAPAWAKAVAIPSPMPDAAPVTNTVFPASSFTRILPVQAATLAQTPSIPGRHMTAFSSDWEACRMSVRGPSPSFRPDRGCRLIAFNRKQAFEEPDVVSAPNLTSDRVRKAAASAATGSLDLPDDLRNWLSLVERRLRPELPRRQRS